MCSRALASVPGLKNEVYSCVARLFRFIHALGSALVSVHGLKNEVYSCLARLFRFIHA